MDTAIGVNRTLLAGAPDGGIRLGWEDCLPHISVAMVPAKRDDLREITRTVDKISRQCSPMSLTIDAVAKRRTGAGRTVSVFHILRTEIIQLFHKTVMNALKPYWALDVGPESFAGGASGSSIDCLTRFPKLSAYERYSPHITLGYGDLPELIPGVDPAQFEATKAAICHLGSIAPAGTSSPSLIREPDAGPAQLDCPNRAGRLVTAPSRTRAQDAPG